MLGNVGQSNAAAWYYGRVSILCCGTKLVDMGRAVWLSDRLGGCANGIGFGEGLGVAYWYVHCMSVG